RAPHLRLGLRGERPPNSRWLPPSECAWHDSPSKPPNDPRPRGLLRRSVRHRETAAGLHERGDGGKGAWSLPIRLFEPRDGTRKRIGYGSQRDVENLRDFAIPQTFRAQVQTVLITRGKGLHACEQVLLPLDEGELLLRPG